MAEIMKDDVAGDMDVHMGIRRRDEAMSAAMGASSAAPMAAEPDPACFQAVASPPGFSTYSSTARPCKPSCSCSVPPLSPHSPGS